MWQIFEFFFWTVKILLRKKPEYQWQACDAVDAGVSVVNGGDGFTESAEELGVLGDGSVPIQKQRGGGKNVSECGNK